MQDRPNSSINPREGDGEAKRQVEDLMTHFWRPQPRHTIFTDSRGHSRHGSLSEAIKTTIKELVTDPEKLANFEEIIGSNFDPESIRFNVFVFPGAQIQQLISWANRHLQHHPRDCIYILGVVNNITDKNKSTKEVTFKWTTPEALKSHLWAYAELGLSWLSQNHPRKG